MGSYFINFPTRSNHAVIRYVQQPQVFRQEYDVSLVTGAAVLVLHHPRKKASGGESSARGSGVLLGYVDAEVELTRYGRLASDANRRRLTVRSRRARSSC